MASLPDPRGEISDELIARLSEAPGGAGHAPQPHPGSDPLGDEDQQLALYVCYELAYRGFDGVDERWEWDPWQLEVRRGLEEALERALRDTVEPLPPVPPPEESDLALRAIIDGDDGPSLSSHLAREGTHDQMLEFMIHRSAYQLKEADPHTFAIPRLEGLPKAAMVSVQADEYGGGEAARVHAEMFAASMEAVGLDREYGAYLNLLPAETLAPVNLMTMMGLHRRLRGGIVGQLALFEMTSTVPNRRYGDALRRLGYGETATAFFDEHVEADAVHENIAAVDMAGGFMRQCPERAADVLFGALAFLELDTRWAGHVWSRWEAGESSLRLPAREPVAG